MSLDTIGWFSGTFERLRLLTWLRGAVLFIHTELGTLFVGNGRPRVSVMNHTSERASDTMDKKVQVYGHGHRNRDRHRHIGIAQLSLAQHSTTLFSGYPPLGTGIISEAREYDENR